MVEKQRIHLVSYNRGSLLQLTKYCEDHKANKGDVAAKGVAVKVAGKERNIKVVKKSDDGERIKN